MTHGPYALGESTLLIDMKVSNHACCSGVNSVAEVGPIMQTTHTSPYAIRHYKTLSLVHL